MVSSGRQWHPTPVLLPGKSRGQRSLVGWRQWGLEESDTTERLHFHFSLSCTGEGNGNPLQCSCLENPRDGGAWWAAIFGVAQSRTQLKRLSSSSSRVAQMVKNLPTVQETWVRSLGQEGPLEKGMATHSSVLAWRIPWTEEPGRLQSLGLQTVRHDWATNTFHFKKSWSMPISQISSVFFCRSLISLALTFRSMTYFEFMFIYGVR